MLVGESDITMQTFSLRTAEGTTGFDLEVLGQPTPQVIFRNAFLDTDDVLTLECVRGLHVLLGEFLETAGRPAETKQAPNGKDVKD